jgi:hypothetical protein
VLAIGGLKEKALAASRVGIRHIIVPAENDKDLAEIPAKIRAGITFTLVETMDDVIRVALAPEAEGVNRSAGDLTSGSSDTLADVGDTARAALERNGQPHDETPLPPDAPAEQPGGIAGA